MKHANTPQTCGAQGACCLNPEPVTLGIMIPCFNEEKNIAETLGNVVAAMANMGVSYHVVVVDDRSTDRTVECVREFVKGTSLPIQCLSNRANEGLGYNYFMGVCLIDSTYYMMINGDNVEPASDIETIVGLAGAADMVIPHWKNLRRRGLVRYTISRAYTHLVNFLSGNHLNYYNGPVLHRRRNVLDFYSQRRTRGFGYQAEIICTLLGKGATCVEVPIEGDICTTRRTTAFRPKNLGAVAQTLFTIATRGRFRRGVFTLDSSRFIVHDLEGVSPSPGAAQRSG